MSDLVDVANRFRKQLIEQERAAAGEMVAAYSKIWQSTRASLAGVMTQIKQAQEAGVEVNQAWLLRQNRLNALQTQVAGQIDLYAQQVEGQILGMQETAVGLADEQFQASMRGAGVELTLNRLPADQVAQLLGHLADGSPLNSLLKGLGQTTSQKLTDALLNGVALGLNPRKVERLARDGMGQVLSHILRIARTETLRPYREYAHQNYLANKDLLDGWYWLSAANARTCASCWAMHGTLHPLTERLDDHPNGRCTQVPAVKGFKQTIPTGVSLFRMLGQAEQLSILGPSKLAAYQDGLIGLSDLVARSSNRAWGSMRREASLQEALGA